MDEGYGWRATTAGPYTVAATSSKRYVLFDFGSVALRQIRIECAQGFQPAEILTGATDSWGRGTGPTPLRAVFIGDSYFEGNFGPGPIPRWQSCWSNTSKLLGWGDPINRGQGGTGYLNDGVATHSTNAILRNRISEIAALNPEVWVLALGVNDTSYTQTQIYNEATYCFAQLKSQMPNAVGYVVGPWSTATAAQTTTLPALSAGVRQAAAEAALPFIEPQTGDIVAGDGTQLVRGQGPIISGVYTSTSSNGGVFFHTDNLHLTQAGHDFIGAWIAAGIQTIESYIAFGRI